MEEQQKRTFYTPILTKLYNRFIKGVRETDKTINSTNNMSPFISYPNPNYSLGVGAMFSEDMNRLEKEVVNGS